MSSPPNTTSRRDRLVARFDYQQVALRSSVVAIVAALPLALMAAPGTARVLGLLYAVVWGLFVLPSSAVYFLLAVDAMLILLRRRPVTLMPALRVAEWRRRGGQAPPRRVVRWMSFIMEGSMLASPFANLAISMLLLAMRLRRDLAAALFREIEEATTEELQMPESVQVAAPTRQLEVLEHEVCAV